MVCATQQGAAVVFHVDDRPTISRAYFADVISEGRVADAGGLERGTSVEHDSAFTLRDVLSMGFEAQCVTSDGARYFWRRTFGLKVDMRSGKATLLTDPALLPDVTWFPTGLGLKQLESSAGQRGRMAAMPSQRRPRGPLGS
jgi:hypothetical protein